MSVPLPAQLAPYAQPVSTMPRQPGSHPVQAPFWRNVGWTPAFVGFLLYVFVIVSYRLNVGTAAMGLALLALLVEPGERRLPTLVAGAAALLAWAGISYTTTEYPLDSWPRLLDFGKICLIAFAAVNVIRTTRRFRFFIIFYLALFAFFPVRGVIFNYFVYGESLQGRIFWSFIFANPNDIAAYFLLALSLTLGVLATERTRWVRWCAYAGVALLPFIMILSQSRGGFLGLLAFVAVVVGQKRHRLRKIGVLVVLSALVFALTPQSAWERIGTIRKADRRDTLAEDQGSARQRYEIWRVAATIAGENPVLGVGLGTYPRVHRDYAERPDFDPFAQGQRDAHSTYLTLLAETGVVGFLLFCVLVLGTVIPAEKVRRRAAKHFPERARQLFYMQAGLVGYAVAGVFGTYGAIVFTYLHLALIYVAAELLRRDLRQLKAWRQAVLNETAAGQPATAAPRFY